MHSINFTDQLIQNIDKPINLNSIKSIKDTVHPIKTSPLTRSPILGDIYLGDARDHVRATNWVISGLIVGWKSARNMDQWFTLFWYLVENKHIRYLELILPKIRQHMIYRLQKHFELYINFLKILFSKDVWPLNLFNEHYQNRI